MATRDEKLEQLERIFGSDDLSRSTIGQILDSQEGELEKAVEALLSITRDAPQQPAAYGLDVRAIDEIHAQFATDFTRSVVGSVFEQNQGDRQQTVLYLQELLANHPDEDAVEAVFGMSPQEKIMMEEEMRTETERRRQQRMVQLEREIQEDKERVQRLEQIRKLENEQRDAEYKARISMLERQQAEEKETMAKLESEMAKVKMEAEAKVRLAKLEVQRKAQEEKQALLKKLAEEARKNLEERKELELQTAEQLRLAREQNAENIQKKEMLVSRIMQQAALCTLSVRYGAKTVIVSWSLGKDMKASPSDWIGFYKVGKPDTKYRQYIKTGGEPRGNHHFPAPKTPGLYEFRYFSDGSYNEVAKSELIHIGPQMTLKASLHGGEIAVSATLKSGELTTRDWLGLYPSSESNNSRYLASTYISSEQIKQEASAITFKAPRTPGDYVVRFFPSRCGYASIASSNTIRVENRDAVSFTLIKDDKTKNIKQVRATWEIHSVDVSSSDYVALYKQGEANGSYHSYAYVDTTNKFVLLDAPKEIGMYELRYHSRGQGKYTDCCRSSPFEVPNHDVVRAETSGGLIMASWEIYSQERTTWDWVGLFERGKPNTSYVEYKYADPASNATTFTVPTTAGIYEVRYFSYRVGKYADFRKSGEIIIA